MKKIQSEIRPRDAVGARHAVPLLFREKIAKGLFVFPGITLKASGYEVVKAIVSAFGYRFNVVYRGRKPR